MRHQRCAGCLGGKAEFPCGLAGVDVGLWDNFGIVLDDFWGDAWYGYYIL